MFVMPTLEITRASRNWREKVNFQKFFLYNLFLYVAMEQNFGVLKILGPYNNKTKWSETKIPPQKKG